MRLNKFISESGICSRREADKYIEQGNVFINNKKAKIGDQVNPTDKVRVNGQDLEPREEEDIIFIALNKPPGITSTTEDGVRENIIQFVNHTKRIFPIGRLDKDSQGLIFLTNNGDIVNKILRAGNNHEKEYVVTVNKSITDEVLEEMAQGVSILGVNTRKCKITRVSATIFKIILKQGLNRQIRRMCEHFGYDVTKLERTRIMNIKLDKLPMGDWRDLTDTEMQSLNKLLKNSTDTDGKKPKTPNTPTSKPAPKKPKTTAPKMNFDNRKKSSGAKPKNNQKSNSSRTTKNKPSGRRGR